MPASHLGQSFAARGESLDRAVAQREPQSPRDGNGGAANLVNASPRVVAQRVAIQTLTGQTVQRIGKEEEQAIRKRQADEGFDHLRSELDKPNARARVRLAARGKSATNKNWLWNDVGHSSILLSVYNDDGGTHAQAGLDASGTVKLEKSPYDKVTSDKYRIVLLEKEVDIMTAKNLATVMQQEIGKSHSYKEWLLPGAQAVGYENCTTWAEKMANVAGLSVPQSNSSQAGSFPDPTMLAGRIAANQGTLEAKGGRVIRLEQEKDKLNINHPDTAKPNRILGDMVSDTNATKWEQVTYVLEQRAAHAPDPTHDLYYREIPGDVLALADAVAKEGQQTRDNASSLPGLGTTLLAVGALAVTGAVATKLLGNRQ